MAMQSLTKIKWFVSNQYTLAPVSTVGNKPIQASSRDYGFDFDEDALAQVLRAPVPASILDRPIPMVEADEFETLYHWFNS